MGEGDDGHITADIVVQSPDSIQRLMNLWGY